MKTTSRPGRRVFLGTVAALMAASLAGCELGAVHLEHETRELQVSQMSEAPIEVRTVNGKVSIVADPSASDVLISAELKAQTIERLALTSVVAARDPNGTLRIGVAWPDGRALRGEGCDFQITVHDAAGVDIKTSNGAILIDGLAGPALLRSSNGRIEALRHAGPVDADTSNGAVRVVDPAGEVRAESSNGSITVLNARSSVHADTSNGRVTIELAGECTGPVFADTSNGRINLTVGRAFAGLLSMKTSNAGVTINGLDAHPGARLVSTRKNAAELRFGDSQAPSTCTSSNGSITLDVRAD